MTADVTVVIATRDRPGLLERAVRAVQEQEFAGEIEILVVFDQTEPRVLDLPEAPGRAPQSLRNTRTPGLAGGRNTGILAASAPLIAFCDDDDEWLPAKLETQIALFLEHPEASLAATGIRIRTEDDEHVRIGPARVELEDYLLARLPEIHPSTFLLRREDLLGDLGLVDEQIPYSYGEDYDLLLRAARLGPTVNVTEPLVTIYWNRPSFFADRWTGIADGLSYILGKTPELQGTRPGRARIEGQVAFARAAAGERRSALRWAGRTVRHDPRQLRAYAAMLVATRVVSAPRMVAAVQARGKGL